MPKQYLDDNGNPIAAPSKTYLDDSGNPISTKTAAPAPKAGPPVPGSKEDYAASKFGNFQGLADYGMAAGQTIIDAGKSLYHTVVDAPRDNAEQATSTLGPGALQAKRLLVDPQVSEYQKAQAIRNNPNATTADRAAGVGHTLAAGIPMLGPMAQGVIDKAGPQFASGDVEGGLGTLGGNATLAFAPDAVSTVKGLAPRAGDLAMRPVRAVTGTGTRAMRDAVKDTRESNVKAQEKVAEQSAKDRATVDKANAKLGQDRSAEVQSHFDKAQAVKAAEERRSGIASRKSAIESGVRKLSDKFQTDLKATRGKASVEANEKYTALNKALGTKTIQSENMVGHLNEAMEKIKGSNTQPPIFKDIWKTVEDNPQISYDDLQGYYSELGRELSKGTLQGDVYTAYSTLQDAIGEEMQNVADSNGMGPQLTDARTTWRNLKQTFYDPKSPLRKALDSKEAGVAVRQLIGKDRTAIEALAKYDPELAQRANVLRGYHEEASGTRVPAESTKPAPQLAPRKAAAPYPEPEVAPVKKIGAQEVQQAKAGALQKRSDLVRHKALWIAAGPPIYALVDMMRGHAPNLGEVAAVSGGIGALSAGIGRLMENPKVVDFLTKATARDVAAIPEDLRGEFPKIVQQAQKQGIRVSPSLTLAFRGAAALAPRRHPTDEWANPQQ